MRPERFVTYCFLYAGLVLLAQYAFIYLLRLDVATLAQLGVGISILVAGVFRLYSPELEEDNPGEYGVLAFSMAFLCILLSVFLFL